MSYQCMLGTNDSEQNQNIAFVVESDKTTSIYNVSTRVLGKK